MSDQQAILASIASTLTQATWTGLVQADQVKSGVSGQRVDMLLRQQAVLQTYQWFVAALNQMNAAAATPATGNGVLVNHPLRDSDERVSRAMLDDILEPRGPKGAEA